MSVSTTSGLTRNSHHGFVLNPHAEPAYQGTHSCVPQSNSRGSSASAPHESAGATRGQLSIFDIPVTASNGKIGAFVRYVQYGTVTRLFAKLLLKDSAGASSLKEKGCHGKLSRRRAAS
jgi:hypothetical protein